MKIKSQKILDGYRLLNKNEIIRAGDLVSRFGIAPFMPTKNDGCNQNPFSRNLYIRKIESK